MTDKQRSPDDYPPFLRSLAELVERLGEKIELLSEESKKTDEQLKKTDEQLKKTDEQLKKTDEQQKQTDKQLKDLGRQMAEASAESKRESAELSRKMAEASAESKRESVELGRKMAEASAESKRESAELSRETAESLAKASAELKYESAELSRKMAEASDKSEREWEKIRQQSGAIDRRFGKLAEAMTLGDVLGLLNSHPQIDVHSLRHNDAGVHEDKDYEIDAFAFGDDCVVVIEAKATLRSGHVSNFISKSANLKNFFDIHQYHRGKKLYGAVAYLKIDDKAKELANKKGLLIIKSTYSNKTLVNPKIKLRDYTTKNNR